MHKKNPVIVVEGNHDKDRIQAVYPTAEVMITNGSEIAETTLIDLQRLNVTRKLILMLDPDVPGERIRKRINAYVGPTSHVFLPKDVCTDKVKAKIGIEHAPLQIIKTALDHHIIDTNHEMTITRQALLHRGLIGGEGAAIKRQKLCESLGIGLANGKTLLKKLNMFGITPETLDRVIE